MINFIRYVVGLCDRELWIDVWDIENAVAVVGSAQFIMDIIFDWTV